MKKYLQEHKDFILIVSYSLVISFLVLFFTSKNSPWYPFNDWVDENAFFTMGKSMMNGVIPYKDIFEQKGPFLYLIFGIGYLISHKTFLGVFILEVITCSISLYFLYKIANIFKLKKSAYLILPLYATFIATSGAFVHGGSAEEFSMPFFFITLYYFFKHFKVKELTKKEMVINGIVAGLILLIKYTLLGFYIGFTFIIFIDYLLKKDYKKSITYPLYLLLGMFIPFGIFLIYFLIAGGLGDFFKVYFLTNMTSYGEVKVSIIGKVIKILKYVVKYYPIYITIGVFIVIAYLLYKFPMHLKEKIYLLIIGFLTLFFVYYGLIFYPYYFLFVLFFVSIIFIMFFSLGEKYLKNKIVNNFLLGVVLVLSVLNAYFRANYKDFHKVSKDDLFQYTFLEEINKEENPTLVNIGFLDAGLYTTSGIVPNTYFFERQNLYKKLTANEDAFRDYIKNKDTTFVLYYAKKDIEQAKKDYPELFTNYSLVKEKVQRFEKKKFYAYLFKKNA